jgi:hypothetical protein
MVQFLMEINNRDTNKRLSMLDIDTKNLKEAKEIVDNIKKLTPRSKTPFRHPWIKLHMRNDGDLIQPPQEEVIKVFKKSLSTYAVLPVTDEMSN